MNNGVQGLPDKVNFSGINAQAYNVWMAWQLHVQIFKYTADQFSRMDILYIPTSNQLLFLSLSPKFLPQSDFFLPTYQSLPMPVLHRMPKIYQFVQQEEQGDIIYFSSTFSFDKHKDLIIELFYFEIFYNFKRECEIFVFIKRKQGRLLFPRRGQGNG